MNKIIYGGIEYKKIVFVCTANKYRSPALEYYFKDQCNVPCESMGVMNSLPLTPKQNNKKSGSSTLNSWVNFISNNSVKEKMLLHKSKKYINDVDNLYIFVSDRHLHKYGNNASNCISVSSFLDISGLDDPLVKVRNGEDASHIDTQIKNIINNIVLVLKNNEENI